MDADGTESQLPVLGCCPGAQSDGADAHITGRLSNIYQPLAFLTEITRMGPNAEAAGISTTLLPAGKSYLRSL